MIFSLMIITWYHTRYKMMAAESRGAMLVFDYAYLCLITRICSPDGGRISKRAGITLSKRAEIISTSTLGLW